MTNMQSFLLILIDWRNELYLEANEWRDNPDPTLSAAATAYLDRWVEDLDGAIYALTETFDTIARRLVTEANPSTVDIVTEEVKKWGKTYGIYITGVPDHMIDGVKISIEVLDAIFEALDFMDIELFDLDELIEELIEEAFLNYMGIPSEEELKEKILNRLSDPSIQLDSSYNPYMQGEDNFKEFKQYMDKYAEEQRLLSGSSLSSIINNNDSGALDNAIDSDFEAFYNTMAMFKLILMGPENFTYYFKSQTGGAIQTAYTTNIAQLEATVLRLAVKTIDMPYSGTDDNVYACVFRVDKSGNIVISGYPPPFSHLLTACPDIPSTSPSFS